MAGIPNLPEVVTNTALHDQAMRTDQSNLRDVPIDGSRPLRVIVIGAGFSGINCAIRIPQRLRNVDLTIYEKNADVGGTWYENRYPGCACDVPGTSIDRLNTQDVRRSLSVNKPTRTSIHTRPTTAGALSTPQVKKLKTI